MTTLPSSRRNTQASTQVNFTGFVESLEGRVLLSVEPVSLLPEVVLPGDLQVGAAPFQQYDPYIAPGPDGITLAIWTDYRTGGHPNMLWGPGNGTTADVWAARIAADGSLIDQLPIAVNNDDWHQTGAKAAWNGTDWLISWNSKVDPSYSQIHATRLSVQGEVLDPDPIVIMDNRFLDEYGNPISPEGPLDVQPAGNNFVVTWSRNEPPLNGSTQVSHFGTLVAADGTLPQPDGTLLRRGSHMGFHWGGLIYSPSNGGQFLQVFGIDRYDASWGNDDLLYVRRRDLNLGFIDTSFRSMEVVDFYKYQQKVIGSPDGWLVTHRASYGQYNPSILAERVAANGTFVDTAPLSVGGPDGDPKLAASHDGNGYVVNYTLNGGQLYHRRIPATGAMGSPVLLQTLGNPIYSMQSVGVGGGTYQVLLADSTGGSTDIALTRVAPDNSLSVVTDVSNAARSHTAPQIASDGTNSLAVFRSFNADTGEIKGTRLTPTGNALDAEPFTIVPASLNPGSVNVVFFEGRYVVVFRGNGPAGNMNYAQQVSTDGQLIGSPVALTGGMGNGEVSVLGDRMILSGLSNEGSLHMSYRFAKIFDENLAAVTDRINLTHGFTGGGSIATVGGRWLLAYSWKSSHDAPRSGVAFAFVAPDGTATAPESLVSTYPDNGGIAVVSAGDNADEAMIVFQRWDLPPELGGPFWFPNSGEGLVGQRMGADGTRLGDGLITIVDQPGTSSSPRAIFDGSNYVVSWVDTRTGVYPEQEIPDVFAARVSIDGTVLDPGGFAVAARHAPEDSVVAVAGAGRTYFAYRSFRYEEPWASYRITTRLLDDSAPPTGLARTFDVNATQAVDMTFSERLYQIEPTDLVVTNRDTGQTVNVSGMVLVEQSGTANEWSYAFHPGSTASLLPDGNYRATLPAGSVVDKSGRPLADAVELDFFVLAGDANRDRHVDLADFGIVRANFGGIGKTFSEGDFNYDATVDLTDFGILRANFGTYLPPPNGGNLFGDGGGNDDDGGSDVLGG